MKPLIPPLYARPLHLLQNMACNTEGKDKINCGVLDGAAHIYRWSLKGHVNLLFYADGVILHIVPRSIRQWPPEKPEETPPRHQPVRRVLDKTEIKFENLIKLLKL